MLHTLSRSLSYAAFGLAVCALVPWVGVVQAQPTPRAGRPGAGRPSGFLPYQPPGAYRPNDPFAFFGSGQGGFNGQGGVGGQGGIGGIGGIGGGGFAGYAKPSANRR